MSELHTVFSGTLAAGMVNEYLMISRPMPSISVKFALRFFSDMTVDLAPINWPPLTFETDDPYEVTIRFNSARRGNYLTRLDTGNAIPFTRLYPRIPISWTLDFAADPVVGRKDQDCDLDLRVTSAGMIPGVASDGVFGGDPTTSTESNGDITMIGSAYIYTWSYEFPLTVENHSYRLGLLVSGTLSPFPPASVPANVAVAVSPYPVPLNVPTWVTVSATDPGDGTQVDGDVIIDGQRAGHTNLAFQYEFRRHEIRERHIDPGTRLVETETVAVPPVGKLKIFGLTDIALDWGISTVRLSGP